MSPRPWLDRIATWSTQRPFKLAIATAFALAHLFVIARAGESRLHLPFNNAPGAHLEFKDPMARSLRLIPRSRRTGRD